jgi:predicted ATPase
MPSSCVTALRRSVSGSLYRPSSLESRTGELLAPVYGWFTEGFDTLDLNEAKALLEELAA